MVVFNPLNIAREDLVEASVDFPEGCRCSSRDRSGRQRCARAGLERKSGISGQGAVGGICGLRCAAGEAASGDHGATAGFGEFARESVLPREAECRRRCRQHFR